MFVVFEKEKLPRESRGGEVMLFFGRHQAFDIVDHQVEISATAVAVVGRRGRSVKGDDHIIQAGADKVFGIKADGEICGERCFQKIGFRLVDEIGGLRIQERLAPVVKQDGGGKGPILIDKIVKGLLVQEGERPIRLYFLLEGFVVQAAVAVERAFVGWVHNQGVWLAQQVLVAVKKLIFLKETIGDFENKRLCGPGRHPGLPALGRSLGHDAPQVCEDSFDGDAFMVLDGQEEIF